MLDRLAKLSYVEAVLRLAAPVGRWPGLRPRAGGIVHRDLKPANVLLTDEGQPMLLDFNLAEDRDHREAAAARVGGTLPYMSPEQLEAFHGKSGAVDSRCDLYSLGVILFTNCSPGSPRSQSAGVTGRRPSGHDRPATSRSAATSPAQPDRSARPSRRSSSVAWPRTPPVGITRPGTSTKTSSGTWRTCRCGIPPNPRSGSVVLKWARRHSPGVHLSIGTVAGIAAVVVIGLAASLWSLDGGTPGTRLRLNWSASGTRRKDWRRHSEWALRTRSSSTKPWTRAVGLWPDTGYQMIRCGLHARPWSSYRNTTGNCSAETSVSCSS